MFDLAFNICPRWSLSDTLPQGGDLTCLIQHLALNIYPHWSPFDTLPHEEKLAAIYFYHRVFLRLP